VNLTLASARLHPIVITSDNVEEKTLTYIDTITRDKNKQHSELISDVTESFLLQMRSVTAPLPADKWSDVLAELARWTVRPISFQVSSADREWPLAELAYDEPGKTYFPGPKISADLRLLESVVGAGRFSGPSIFIFRAAVDVTDSNSDSLKTWNTKRGFSVDQDGVVQTTTEGA
jgi:hypothetical protein